MHVAVDRGIGDAGERARPAPLAVPAIALAGGILAGEQGASVGWLLTGVGVVVAAGWFYLRACGSTDARGAALRVGVVAVLAAVAGFARYHAVTTLPGDHIARMISADEPLLARIEGVIVVAPSHTPAERRNAFLPMQPSPSTRFVLDVVRTWRDAEPVAARGYIAVTVHAPPEAWRLGDRVVATGWLRELRGPRNPGETDWRAWYARQRIHAGLSVEDSGLISAVQAGERSALGFVAWWRTLASGVLFEGFSPEDAESRRLLDALVLGQRSAVDRALNEAFLRTGAIHFLSVSGYHVGLLTFVTWWLLKKLRRGARTTAAIALLLLLAYALIAEPNSPILRAVIMGVSLCVAALLRRPFSGINWLSFSAIALLALNPLELFQAGFQFSFLQVGALLTVVPVLYRRLAYGAPADGFDPSGRDVDTWTAMFRRRVWRIILGLTLTCFSCWLIALPLTLYHFALLGIWAPLQSILITPLVSLVTVLGFLQMIVGLVPVLGDLTTELLLLSTGWLLSFVRWLGSWPFSLIEVTRPALWIVIVAEIALFGLMRLTPRPPRGRYDEFKPPTDPNRWRCWAIHSGCLLMLVVAIAAWRYDAQRQSDAFEICVLDVGNGSAALLRDSSGVSAAIDAGTLHNFDVGRTVNSAAAAMRVRSLAFVAVSHGDLDHYAGVPAVAAAWRPSFAYSHSALQAYAARSPLVRRLVEETTAAGATWERKSAGDLIEIGRAKIEVLWPPRTIPEAWEENDRSLVLRLSAYGVRVLLPGDAAGEALRGMIEAHDAREIDLRADVLIAPHHGAVVSRFSEAFYRRVEPECVVVSTGRDRPELRAMVEAIFEGSCRLLSTEESGAIFVRVTPDCQLKIETPFEGEE